MHAHTREQIYLPTYLPKYCVCVCFCIFTCPEPSKLKHEHHTHKPVDELLQNQKTPTAAQACWHVRESATKT